MNISRIMFTGKPSNYVKIDDVVSRSAQPQKADFDWLKDEGVTDVFNFRTASVELDFDEKTEVEKRGMKYHSIPSYTRNPDEANVDRFLKEVDEVKANGGKAHIHCKAGADRTGMYSFIYKAKNHIDTMSNNMKEWFEHGYHQKLFPNLTSWAENFVNKRFGK
jgi:protein tyrosine phosphatase (PTP) superfamily phosphohydrolase (DUF442 family)